MQEREIFEAMMREGAKVNNLPDALKEKQGHEQEKLKLKLPAACVGAAQRVLY